jgi:hypothetical protein
MTKHVLLESIELVMFRALSNHDCFDSDNGASSGFGKSIMRGIEYTIGLRRETRYKTHHVAVKMSFRRVGVFLPRS